MSPRTARALPLVLGLTLAIAACGEPGDQPEPVATPTAEGEPVSILRPDVEGPAEIVPAEPLVVVVPFAEGGSELSEDALLALRDVAASDQFAGEGSITLRGHSDAGGSDAVNMRAAGSRAEAVRDWLVENGADEGRIAVISFGEQNPVAPNALPDGSPDEEGRSANRRVEVTIQPRRAQAGEESPAAAAAPAEGPSS